MTSGFWQISTFLVPWIRFVYICVYLCLCMCVCTIQLKNDLNNRNQILHKKRPVSASIPVVFGKNVKNLNSLHFVNIIILISWMIWEKYDDERSITSFLSNSCIWAVFGNVLLQGLRQSYFSYLYFRSLQSMRLLFNQTNVFVIAIFCSYNLWKLGIYSILRDIF